MNVRIVPHRVTGDEIVLAQCDSCDECMYVPGKVSYEAREAVKYLVAIGWKVVGPYYAPASTNCPDHEIP